MHYSYVYDSHIGTIEVASDEDCLTSLKFIDSSATNSDSKSLELINAPFVIQKTVAWLDSYFNGECPSFTPCFKLVTTPFCKEVCDMMLKIPYGTTVTYGEIAHELALKHGIDKMSAQAVGGAVGRNPIPIIIPCHRVVGKNDKLTGYAYGIDKKLKLLELEGVDTTNFYI